MRLLTLLDYVFSCQMIEVPQHTVINYNLEATERTSLSRVQCISGSQLLQLRTFKVPITSVGILHICNLWILLKKHCDIFCRPNIFIFVDFFAVKVIGSDVNPGICLYENGLDSQIDVTSINLNSKKVYEDEIFGRQNILQFFSGESKDCKYVKFAQRLQALQVYII